MLINGIIILVTVTTTVDVGVPAVIDVAFGFLLLCVVAWFTDALQVWPNFYPSRAIKFADDYQYDHIYTVDSSYNLRVEYEAGFRNPAPKRGQSGSKVLGYFEKEQSEM